MEDLLKSYEVYEKEEFKEIPPLGTHYSLKWAKKDSKEEKETSNWVKSENDVEDIDNAKELEAIA